MRAGQVTQVVVAAGGLGTRVQQWSRFLPKEFYPVNGTPGIVHLFDEIAALQPVQVAVVYHPYYEPFIPWARLALQPGGRARYQAARCEPIPPDLAVPQIDLAYVVQHGPYADVTSILNGADHLPRGPFLLAFADNLYPGAAPLLDLNAASPHAVAVLGRPFNLEESRHRGVIICRPAGNQILMCGLTEKPDATKAAELLNRYGPDNLRLLEGRAHLTTDFIDHLRTTPNQPNQAEPKLSRALAEYSQKQRVEVITTTAPVIDLGAADTTLGSDNDVKTWSRTPGTKVALRSRTPRNCALGEARGH